MLFLIITTILCVIVLFIKVHCREFAKLPHVHFILGGKDHIIESKYYIQHVSSEKLCILYFNITGNFFFFNAKFYREWFNLWNMSFICLVGKSNFLVFCVFIHNSWPGKVSQYAYRRSRQAMKIIGSWVVHFWCNFTRNSTFKMAAWA